MKVSDVFSELKFQPPMSAGNMMVVPITSRKPLDSMSGEMVLQVTGDDDYSRLTIKNLDDKPTIVPSGMRFYANKGQDRVVKKTSIVDAESEDELYVGCIEPSEANHMARGTDNYSFIPAQLRISTIQKQDSGSYEAIWDDIKKYLADAGVSGNAMKNFYNTFDKELEEFVAQFEPVKDQVGAAVFINNQLAGIEIYPNHGAWLKVWRHLIRDSYGADAIKLIQKKAVVSLRPLVKVDAVNDIEDLEKEVARVKTEYSNFVMEKLNGVLGMELLASEPSIANEYSVYTVKSDGFIGHLVRNNNKVAFFSLLRGS